MHWYRTSQKVSLIALNELVTIINKYYSSGRGSPLGALCPEAYAPLGVILAPEARAAPPVSRTPFMSQWSGSTMKTFAYSKPLNSWVLIRRGHRPLITTAEEVGDRPTNNTRTIIPKAQTCARKFLSSVVQTVPLYSYFKTMSYFYRKIKFNIIQLHLSPR